MGCTPEGLAMETKNAGTARVDELLTNLRKEITRRSPNLENTDLAELAASMAKTLPRAGENRTAKQVGPFYEESIVAKWIGISRQAVKKRADANKILVCITGEGARLYPTWQFTDDAQVLLGLNTVLAALAEGKQDGWTVGLWLTTPDDDLGGATAAQWLKAGKTVEPVLRDARHDAARWTA
jgi:hypothetical protein